MDRIVDYDVKATASLAAAGPKQAVSGFLERLIDGQLFVEAYRPGTDPVDGPGAEQYVDLDEPLGPLAVAEAAIRMVAARLPRLTAHERIALRAQMTRTFASPLADNQPTTE